MHGRGVLILFTSQETRSALIQAAAGSIAVMNSSALVVAGRSLTGPSLDGSSACAPALADKST